VRKNQKISAHMFRKSKKDISKATIGKSTQI